MSTTKISQACPEVRETVHPVRYISQFFLGPVSAKGLRGWHATDIDRELRLWTHPELNVTQVTSSTRSLTLIGCLLDPGEPTATDTDILNGLHSEFSDLAALIAATTRLGGRWILIAASGNEKYLFHDAFGLRQVFYTAPGFSDSLLAMSQPKMGADLLGLSIDEGARRLIDSYEFRSNSEYKWPGAGTPYREIKHLLPNHCLDLTTGLCHRYWPNQQLQQTSLEDAVIQLSGLFRGLVKAAAERFDLAIPVTAGIDSRLILAASREISDKVAYCTVRQYQAPDDHPDMIISAKLLGHLGLKHHIIKASVSTSPEFSFLFKKNVFMAHDHYAPDAEAILNYFSRKKVVVTGSGAEVGRCYHNLPIRDKGRITPRYLSRLEGMGGSDASIPYFQQWLDGVGNTYNVDKLDLFEWDIGTGNWVAMTQLEFDIAWKDNITPYNCRRIMEIMLSVDKKYRRGPKNILFMETIRNMWPDVLSEPINPHKSPGMVKRSKQLVRKLLEIYLHKILRTGIR